jgi:CRISPR system Cascade subunit CasD
MTHWLVITLAGPLASFGETAGNAERGTADRPTRSALLGLAGAALGIDRNDHDGQQRLAASLAIATNTLRPGALLRDFHTYQSVHRSKGRFATRRAALALPSTEIETSITRREYRSDGLWHAAYSLKTGATLTLEELAQAFRAPHYTLYLGRKSCPPGHPLVPELIAAETLAQAFASYAQARSIRSDRATTIASDDLSSAGAGNRPVRRHVRVDEPLDRSSWQFAARDEFVFMSGGDKEGGS